MYTHVTVNTYRLHCGYIHVYVYVHLHVHVSALETLPLSSSGTSMSVCLHIKIPAQVLPERQLGHYARYVFQIVCTHIYTYTLLSRTHTDRVLSGVFTDDSIPWASPLQPSGQHCFPSWGTRVMCASWGTCAMCASWGTRAMCAFWGIHV